MRVLQRLLIVTNLLIVVTVSPGCGERVERLGVLVEEIGMTKSSLGPSPADVPALHYAPGSGPVSNFRRMKKADLTGDGQLESIIGRENLSGVDVFGPTGSEIIRLDTARLIDFGAVQASRTDRSDLVIYTYPFNGKTGTFTILQIPEQRQVATWDETPGPPAFATEQWRGADALWYFRGGRLVIRDVKGQLLLDLPVPEAVDFRWIYTTEVGDGYVAVLTSGNGYTPYHMVCVFSEDGALRYQEVAEEHAFDIRRGNRDGQFDVFSRSVQWRYEIKDRSGR
jgi:hypothetical protein